MPVVVLLPPSIETTLPLADVAGIPGFGNTGAEDMAVKDLEEDAMDESESGPPSFGSAQDDSMRQTVSRNRCRSKADKLASRI